MTNFEELAHACELIAQESLVMSGRARQTLRLAAAAVRELAPRLERLELAMRVQKVPDPWGKGWKP